MAKVGIMHSGSQNMDGDNVTAFQTSLASTYNAGGAKKGPLDYGPGPLYAIDLGQDLPHLADQWLNAYAPLDILVAAGGSQSAVAAQTERAQTKTPNLPVILFTSVAPYVCDNLAPNMTGVCARTSDHDVARLYWLTQMPIHGDRIGVLRNAGRGDQQKQIHDLNQAAGTTWKIRPRDIKHDGTLKESFRWLHGDVRSLLVAADPFFNENRKDVVDRVNAENYPAIFQWSEFVKLGGLMSYGPNITKLYQQAGTMAADILNNGVVPPIWEPQDPRDFELAVSKSRAKALQMWPLPQPVLHASNYVEFP